MFRGILLAELGSFRSQQVPWWGFPSSQKVFSLVGRKQAHKPSNVNPEQTPAY